MAPDRITLEEIAEGRRWCPFSGSRARSDIVAAGENGVSGGDPVAFAPESRCLGPACAAWCWTAAPGRSHAPERRRCHLVPPDFNPRHRVRLVSQIMPDLTEPFQVLALGTGDSEAARTAILTWARSHWRPEQDLTDGAWQRQGEPFWETDGATPALDLVRVLPAPTEGGCGLCRL